MKKSQIYTLLDVPHFPEGFNVRRWNYILNFYTGDRDEYLPCQYQIRFGRGGRVEQTYFMNAACAELLDRWVTPAAVTTEPASTNVAASGPAIPGWAYVFTFAFDSSEIDNEALEVIQADAVDNGDYREVNRHRLY